ncbi:MAG: hypothetical protein CMJ76_16585 [Planctomycetaceae bacterium]|nr:hypothetical protein [Planctomycetaceae bacterium]|tara:strand:- start:4735 stop:5331 length:597 start_codon:yes stop_codon:yes gene_type:complete
MDITDSFNSIRPDPNPCFGSITMMIRQVGNNSPHAQQELFVAVIDQLKNSARSMLRQFPKVREFEEDALVNEIYLTLLKKLLSKDIKNRQHFFATACNYFRWTLLDLVKRKKLETEPLLDDYLLTEDKVATLEHTEFLVFAFAQLDDLTVEYRQIFESHVFLGMSFNEISEMLEIPKSTVHDHFAKTKAILKQAFKNL